MTKPRIAFVIPSMNIGGTERQLLVLMQGLRDAFDITLVCTREEGKWFAEAQALANEVHVLGARSGWDFRMGRPMKQIFQQSRQDVVHTFQFGFDYWAVRAARAAGVPVVITSRRELAHWQEGRHLWLLRKANALADCAVANSRAVADFAAGRERQPAAYYRVIYNGLSPQAFELADADAARARFGLPARGHVVGMVANFSPVKDHNLFVHMANLLGREMPGTHFFLVGSGEARASIEHALVQNNGRENVTIRAVHENMQEVYAAMDVCVLTSQCEGAPNALLEAMAAARPVVATRVGGIPELVLHRETGLLENSRDPALLCDQIATLLKDASLRARMGAAGLAHARDFFTSQRMVNEHANLYTTLLQVRGAS